MKSRSRRHVVVRCACWCGCFIVNLILWAITQLSHHADGAAGLSITRRILIRPTLVFPFPDDCDDDDSCRGPVRGGLSRVVESWIEPLSALALIIQ